MVEEKEIEKVLGILLELVTELAKESSFQSRKRLFEIKDKTESLLFLYEHTVQD